MSEERVVGKYVKRKKEENIIYEILRLLAEEHFISLEEEIRGKEILQREMME